MKILSSFILITLILQCICLTKLRRKIQTTQQNDLSSYNKAILDEINEYRYDHQYDPQIKWSKNLADKANKEVSQLKKSKDFGSAARFHKLQKEIADANFLTQFAIRIETPSGMPNQKAFAIMVVEAILQDYQYNFMQRYTDGGIAVTSSKKNEYLVIVQLIKKLGTYKSCKEAKSKGDMSDQIFIKRFGKKEVLNCDQITDNGGWSLILDVNRITKEEPLYISVDDRDLEYKELLFRTKEGFHLSYYKNHPRHWEMDGLILQFFYFRFGNIWYSEKNCNKGARYQNPQTYDRAKDVKFLKQADKCYWKWRCAKEFIITKLPKGKFTQISELHTMEQQYIYNDYFDLFFDIYVR